MFDHPNLEKFKFIQPGKLAKAILKNFRFQRRCNLTLLTKTHDSMCAWCNKVYIQAKNRKYCGEACSGSAYMFCNPHCPEAKMFIFLKLQGATCLACGEIYEDQIKGMIQKRYQSALEWNRKFGDHRPDVVTFYAIGNNTGEFWHVDHVKPISKGGDGIGFENIQVICKKCHLRKTARENMGLPVASV